MNRRILLLVPFLLGTAFAQVSTFEQKQKQEGATQNLQGPVPAYISDAYRRHSTLPPMSFAPVPGGLNALQQPGGPALHATYDVVYEPRLGTPSWIRGPLPESSPTALAPEAMTEAAYRLLESLTPILPFQQIRQELTRVHTEVDARQIAHIRFDQQYKGVAVRNGQVFVHLYPNNTFVINGFMVPSRLAGAAQPTLDAAAAAQLALDEVAEHHPVQSFTAEQQAILQYEGPQTRLVWYAVPGQVREVKLAWEITTRPTFVHRWEYVLDAHTGEVLLSYDHTCSIGPTSASGTDLNGQARNIQVFQASGGYYLLDASRSMYSGPTNTLPSGGDGFIFTGDWKNNPPSNANYSDIVSANNTWTPLQVSAQHNAALSYLYFENTFSRNSINGNKGDVYSFVNVADDDGQGLDNAFWNGVAMFYGNGRQAFKPLAGSLDVAGHEMSHGVVQATANLEYQGESGALNESFADIFGVMIDRDDWLLGEDVVKTQFFPSGALRSMSDPHNGGSSLNDNGYQPRHMNEKYTGTQDNGGVHINSGIANFAFYKLATATTKAKAEQIYYRALTQYLTRSSQFVDARIAVIQAATDIHGANSAEVNAARTAFDQVGILGSTGGNYDPTVPTNPGQEFIVSTDVNTVDPRTLYLSSTTGTNYQGLSNTTHLRKMSITDNGELAYFVDGTNNIRALYTNPANPAEQQLTTDSFWDNVAITKKGDRIAAVSTEVDTALWIYDFTLQQWGKYTLYNPTYTQGINTGDVLYADAIVWDHTGEYVLYDAFNRITSLNGQDREYWDVGIIRVWNNGANYFGDGLVTKIFTNLDAGISVGNAAFSTNSPNVIAFDFINANTNEYAVLAANIETGDVGTIFTQSVLGVPAYSNKDDKLIFSALDQAGTEVVAVVSLAPSKIVPAAGAQATVLIPEAKWGVWIAKGQRVINLSNDKELTAQLTAYPNPVQDRLELEIDELPAGGGSLKVYDITGRVVHEESWPRHQAGSASWSLDTSRWPAGVYTLHVQTLEGRRTLSVMKN